MLERVPAKYFKLMLKYLATIESPNSKEVSLSVSTFLTAVCVFRESCRKHNS